MARIKIMTDGAADVPLELAQAFGIEVVPLLFHVGELTHQIGVSLTEEQLYEMLFSNQAQFRVSSPSAVVYDQIYRNLLDAYDYVFSIHSGTRLCGSYEHAAHARSRLPASNTRIDLFDSKSIAHGTGSIVLAAARAVQAGAEPDEVYALIQAMIRHTHAVFFVDTMEYLERSGKLAIASNLLGSMQRIKPLMILDEGEIVPYERTRTRAKAIEGLYTFVEDFPRVREVIIHYVTSPEDVEKLIEKIEPIFDREHIQVVQFGPASAANLGPGAMGVVVFEGFDEV
jgi:DegV family protein with EDD domain